MDVAFPCPVYKSKEVPGNEFFQREVGNTKESFSYEIISNDSSLKLLRLLTSSILR
jgi:hypothetical protein